MTCDGAEGDDEDDDDHEEEGGADISLEQQTIHARLMHNGAIGPFNSFSADLTSTTFEQTETVEEEDGIERSEFEQDSLHLRGEFTGDFNDWQTLVGLEYRDTDLTAPDHEHEDEDGGKRMRKRASTAFCRTLKALNMVCLFLPSARAMIGSLKLLFAFDRA